MFTSYSLWFRASRTKQRAEEVMIGGVHDAIHICVFPPASAQVTRVTRTKLGGPSDNLLELTFEGQGIFDNECVVVQSLAGDVDHTRSLIPTSRRSRDNHQQRDEDHDEKHG